MPQLAVDPNDRRVRSVPLVPPIPVRRIALVWHADRYRAPAAAAFVELARAVCDELAT
jgi:DNA-binding transcriptional LysR family regulator